MPLLALRSPVWECIWGLGLNGVIVVSARRHLGRLFSINPQVTDSFSQIGALAAVAYFVLSFFFYAFAVLKAQARSMPIMVGFAFGAWLVGVPMAYMLGVNQSHPSLVGIWHGMICGYAVTSAITFTVAIGWPNWHLEAQKAVARSHIKTKQFLPPQEIAMLLARDASARLATATRSLQRSATSTYTVSNSNEVLQPESHVTRRNDSVSLRGPSCDTARDRYMYRLGSAEPRGFASTAPRQQI
ncbi:unnamed protein product [Peronospora belbahrii]|uniref:Uncharacterized protein n=1 Tax=Peronospora belbahrii TaxID=622444 RepID=A0ABN8CMN5_9STRA|nr:unnamed protein product [Peronospora belbahrii]